MGVVLAPILAGALLEVTNVPGIAFYLGSLVSDNDLLTSMQYYREYSNILAEPACAASLAAILGPLKEEISGKSVGVIACGS